MQWLVIPLAIVVAAGYFVLVVLISVPLTGPLVLIGAGFGLVVSLVLVGGVLTGRLTSNECDPASYADRRRPGPLPVDDVWPEYFAAQVWWDAVAVKEWAWDWTSDQAASLVGFLFRRPALVKGAAVAFPVSVPVALGLLAVPVGLLVGLLFAAVVAAVVTGTGWLVGGVLTGVIRGYDTLWARLHHATAACPVCFHVTALPAYRCDGDHDPVGDPDDGLHFDVRPGRQGVLFRTCACGRRLPSGLRRTRRMLAPFCPLHSCGQALHPDTGRATDLRVALIGAGSAGKTALLGALVDDLVESYASAGYRITAGDEASRQRIVDLRADRAVARDPVPTDPQAVPPGLVLHLARHGRRGLLQLFDAAGDRLADPDLAAELAYLEHVRALMFVLDPFGLRAVREQARQLQPDLLERARAATYPVEQAYQDSAILLRNSGVAGPQRLAVVVTKADLLAELPLGQKLGRTSAEIRDWLIERGEDNLVLAAGRDFRRTRYFRCSGAATAGRESALPGLRWLLSPQPLAPRPLAPRPLGGR